MSQDKEIIDTADKWREQEHERKQYELKRKNSRRDKLVDTITSPYFWGWGLAIMFVLSFMVILSFSPSEIVNVDCSGADKKQLEAMLAKCELKDASGGCVEHIHSTFCRVTTEIVK